MGDNGFIYREAACAAEGLILAQPRFLSTTKTQTKSALTAGSGVSRRAGSCERSGSKSGFGYAKQMRIEA